MTCYNGAVEEVKFLKLISPERQEVMRGFCQNLNYLNLLKMFLRFFLKFCFEFSESNFNFIKDSNSSNLKHNFLNFSTQKNKIKTLLKILTISTQKQASHNLITEYFMIVKQAEENFLIKMILLLWFVQQPLLPSLLYYVEKNASLMLQKRNEQLKKRVLSGKKKSKH